MSEHVARIHQQAATPVGVLRVLGGWLIALTGAGLLLAQLISGVKDTDVALQNALAGGAMAALATALGALPLLAVRRIGASAQGMLLGFGAGVMLAASVFSLLLPALAVAGEQGASPTAAALQIALALGIGAAMLLAADRMLPHQHVPDERRSGTAVWLFVFAIALHNVPEGLAIGVASTAGTGAVATGISLQNVPEGLIVAIALVSAGYSRLFSFALAVVSGLVEPLAALAGALMVSTSTAMLPWALGGAAGAMLFVVSHEIIPESHRRGHETLATSGLIAGFIAMMLLDGMLG